MEEIKFTEFLVHPKLGVDLQVRYYQRSMGNYHAHVFLCSINTAEELNSSWKKIVNHIAVRFQSKIREQIERTNFYIGFFCAEDMTSADIKLIEQDTFCARKYVFDDMGSFQDPVAAMESHIFQLELKELAQVKAKARLSQVVLQNFRGYKGRATFDLTDRNGKPASFVLLYAPNGTGKTSFADGIEFALNGKVARLEELKENSKEEGAVYHHFDKRDQQSYVQLFTQQGENPVQSVAPRLVPPLKDGKETHANLRIKKGFLRGDNWTTFLLPHNKVDSFITANTPEQRFNSWTREDINTQKTAEDLKAKRRSLLEARRNLNNKNKEIEKLKADILALEDQKEIAQQLIQFVSDYNALSDAADKLPEISTSPDKDTYTNLLMVVREKQDNLNTELQRIDVEKSRLNQWMQQGLDTMDQEADRFRQLQEQLNQLTAHQITIEKKKALLADILHLDGEIAANYQELLPYQSLEAYGLEKTFQKLRDYNRVLSLLDAQNSELASSQKQLHRIEDKLQECQELLSELEEADERTQNVGALADALKQALKRKQFLGHERLKFIKEIDRLDAKGTDYPWTQLPEMEEPFNLGNCDLHAFVRTITEVQNQLATAKKKKEEFVSAIHQESEELEEIQTRALNYLTAHEDTCSCPVCHSRFDSWSTLLTALQRLDARESQFYQAKLGDLQTEIAGMEARCAELSADGKAILQTYLHQVSDAYDTISTQIQHDADQLMDLCLFTADISLKELPDEAWKYRRVLAQNQKEHAREAESLKKEERKLQKQIQAQLTKIDAVSQELSVFEKDEDFRTLLPLAKKLESAYQGGIYQRLRSDRDDCKAKREEAVRALSALTKTEAPLGVSEDGILLQIDSCKRQIQELEENINYYLPYYRNPQAVETRLATLTGEQEHHTQQLQSLSRITTLDSLLPYLTNYQPLQDQLKEASKEKRTLNRRLALLEKEQNALMDQVRTDIQTYLSDMDANRIYQKIDPSNELNQMEITLDFNEDKPQLNYSMRRKDPDKKEEGYSAELFLSTAQLNAVAFSSFFARALAQTDNDLYTIVMDDPIGSFDDMNMLGFADLIRCIIMNTDIQIIMSTHDSKIYNILRRKLDENYHSSKFFELPNDLDLVDVEDPY